MKLKSISISNFRSIEDATIELKNNCNILLGINESGKSNVLAAISALSDESKFEFNSDSKIPVDGKYQFKEPEIRYYFELSNDDKKEIIERSFIGEYQEWPIKYSRKFVSSLNRFIDLLFGDQSYKITITKKNEKEDIVYYSLHSWTYELKNDFYITKSTVNVKIEGKTTSVDRSIFISNAKGRIENFDAIKSQLVRISKEEIDLVISTNISQYIRENLPKIFFWKYSDNLLLSEAIDIAAFKENPEISIPLRNIFHLAGIENIKERIENDSKNDSAFINLKKVLSDAATKHLRNIWKDYKDIKIDVQDRASKLLVVVQDKKNVYNFKQRSDGFKRFISFLFLLSAEYKSDSLPNNSILIFDEPDVGLHPSGIRHLLNEILHISEKNYCFVATHSIFFIDRNNIGRHLIVTKESESTQIETADYQNFAEEEVLYNALGFSVYDVLKKINICFEGWTDNKIFNLLSEYFKKELKEEFKTISNLGILWSSGANKICQTLKPICSNKSNTCFAIADHDNAGIKEKELFGHEFAETENKFFTYRELSKKRKKEVTLEDLLPDKIIRETLNDHLSSIVSKKDLGKIFAKNDIESNGIIYSWGVFCQKYYKSYKSELSRGYKNKIPMYVEEYLNNNKDEYNRLKSEFRIYIDFIKKLLEFVK